ncbi:MAG: hypothetical protein HND52_07375 [Ignavibacteriae bacterium]|nr:hypothetical protein [Ignavibacteriota bacterium]NOG97765.1 hypothetical protein [Ignavibacteriota bacterium]
MHKDILAFQKDCFQNYIPTIQKELQDFPKKYVYPDGNPIRPVVPVQTTKNSIILIGAFPSARFERRGKYLIPVADNLSPFGEEKYFDGRETRIQASRESLNKNYFPQLNINPEKIWITDLVKIYLYPEKHIKNCKEVNPKIKYVNTHTMFKKIAQASKEWVEQEIKICNPKLIITLGEIPARVIVLDNKTPNKKLLDGSINTIKLDKEYKIAHLAHPEIRRRNKEWDRYTKIMIKKLSREI